MADELILSAKETTDDGNLADIIGSIRRLIDGATLDCACRTEIDQLLFQFETLAAGHHRRRRLDLARGQRRRIAAIMELLRELDEIGYEEADGSVLAEAQLLFEDIAEAARHGADNLAGAMRGRPEIEAGAR